MRRVHDYNARQYDDWSYKRMVHNQNNLKTFISVGRRAPLPPSPRKLRGKAEMDRIGEQLVHLYDQRKDHGMEKDIDITAKEVQSIFDRRARKPQHAPQSNTIPSFMHTARSLNGPGKTLNGPVRRQEQHKIKLANQAGRQRLAEIESKWVSRYSRDIMEASEKQRRKYKASLRRIKLDDTRGAATAREWRAAAPFHKTGGFLPPNEPATAREDRAEELYYSPSYHGTDPARVVLSKVYTGDLIGFLMMHKPPNSVKTVAMVLMTLVLPQLSDTDADGQVPLDRWWRGLLEWVEDLGGALPWLQNMWQFRPSMVPITCAVRALQILDDKEFKAGRRQLGVFYPIAGYLLDWVEIMSQSFQEYGDFQNDVVEHSPFFSLAAGEDPIMEDEAFEPPKLPQGEPQKAKANKALRAGKSKGRSQKAVGKGAKAAGKNVKGDKEMPSSVQEGLMNGDKIKIFMPGMKKRLDMTTCVAEGSHESWATILVFKKVGDETYEGQVDLADLIGIYSADNGQRLDAASLACEETHESSGSLLEVRHSHKGALKYNAEMALFSSDSNHDKRMDIGSVSGQVSDSDTTTFSIMVDGKAGGAKNKADSNVKSKPNGERPGEPSEEEGVAKEIKESKEANMLTKVKEAKEVEQDDENASANATETASVIGDEAITAVVTAAAKPGVGAEEDAAVAEEAVGVAAVPEDEGLEEGAPGEDEHRVFEEDVAAAEADEPVDVMPEGPVPEEAAAVPEEAAAAVSEEAAAVPEEAAAAVPEEAAAAGSEEAAAVPEEAAAVVGEVDAVNKATAVDGAAGGQVPTEGGSAEGTAAV